MIWGHQVLDHILVGSLDVLLLLGLQEDLESALDVTQFGLEIAELVDPLVDHLVNRILNIRFAFEVPVLVVVVGLWDSEVVTLGEDTLHSRKVTVDLILQFPPMLLNELFYLPAKFLLDHHHQEVPRVVEEPLRVPIHHRVFESCHHLLQLLSVDGVEFMLLQLGGEEWDLGGVVLGLDWILRGEYQVKAQSVSSLADVVSELFDLAADPFDADDYVFLSVVDAGLAVELGATLAQSVYKVKDQGFLGVQHKSLGHCLPQIPQHLHLQPLVVHHDALPLRFHPFTLFRKFVSQMSHFKHRSLKATLSQFIQFVIVFTENPHRFELLLLLGQIVDAFEHIIFVSLEAYFVPEDLHLHIMGGPDGETVLKEEPQLQQGVFLSEELFV